ncbi:MAG: hypothetical protein A3B38_02850 [Candidatus Levybacteria bacterium RIFCSPLOWO2_01_FULL_36_13]|nr:MAG: hypothetical protein A3B38_02850 [Candidatus Levybacteria bacterium RIFCSPLOWO2_01_FULL_36_13]
MWHVYILRSKIKRWYYVGSTNRLQKRILEHNSGNTVSTKAYRPFDLIFNKTFKYEIDARKYERKLKDKRIEKEQIIKSIENI